MKTDIRSALLAARSSNQGSPVPAIDKVHREMKELGLIGPECGLTAQGASVRDHLVRQMSS